MAYDFNASKGEENSPTGKISHINVRIDNHPVYSGSKIGAQVAINNALTQAQKEGRAEPVVVVSQRTVDYDLPDTDPNKVTETEISL